MPDEKTRLYLGDALSVLNNFPSGSFDAAVFDPAYPTIPGGANTRSSGGHQRPSGILAKNDGKIFEHNDVHPRDYLPEVFRVLKDQAHVYMMTNGYNIFERDVLLDVKRAGFQVHNLLVWRKNNATPNRWYMKDLEFTIFARKGKAFPIAHAGTRSSGDVFPHPLDWDNVKSPKSHPTEKPVNLMATYIKNSTQPGDTVLDLFMGTGATGVACQQLGRRFVGIEIDRQYCEAASRRLASPVIGPPPLPDIAALLGEVDEIDALLA